MQGAVAEAPVNRFACNVTLSLYQGQEIMLGVAHLQKLQRADLITIWRVRCISPLPGHLICWGFAEGHRGLLPLLHTCF